jgi:hypothetical protein
MRRRGVQGVARQGAIVALRRAYARNQPEDRRMTQRVPAAVHPPSVFEHAKRRDWGLGILAWETTGKRGYVFENGQLRVVVEPFYRLMREVELPLDEVRQLAACLKPELDAARAERGHSSITVRRPVPARMSFDDQVAALRRDFPGGLAGAAWQERQRGGNAKKRLPAHRDAACAEAQEKLAAHALAARVSAHAFGSIYEDVTSLLRRTDLVPTAELAVLANADAERQRAFALMVAELLHGKSAFGPKCDHFLTCFKRAFEKSPGWQLATTLPALLEPENHVPVRPATFRAQSAIQPLTFALPKTPNAAAYLRCLALARRVSAKLADSGEQPRDLLDVYDFMCLTAKSGARAR